ncbi:hypothetical protein [Synechocystis sp. PCC 6714]|uniref:hypothetical protein n=1 Tax=Synechocystis sp. (strain PCC 6714) TaxID=1147 RepID=UPI000410F60D|nr:hypothetical protein [Synechocystis sp. PCC 6714]AIE76133.1 hypothetical protein D082_40870 [Synechocystis sp. PCC 6714]
METITIPVSPEVAQAYQQANPEQQRALQTMLKLFLDANFMEKSLSQVMEDIATKAEQRGLTPEILEAILNDDAE